MAVAERVGFEPTEVLPSPAFEAGALDQLCDLSKDHADFTVDTELVPPGGIGPPAQGLGNLCSIH